MNVVEIIAGPTASGKSALALQHCETKGNREIINADAMQCYEDLRILTARQNDRGHLYGYLKAYEHNDVMAWHAKAVHVIEGLHSKGSIPVVVGGTGFYIKALMQGLSPIPSVDSTIQEEVRSWPRETLWQRAGEIDPLIHAKLHPNDTQRVQRAVCVFLSTHQSLFVWQSIPPVPSPYDFKVRMVEIDRTILRARIQRRFEQMLREGVIAEVQALIQKYPDVLNLPIAKVLGVREIYHHCITSPNNDALQRIPILTRQYAKRQITWFKHQLPSCL